MRSSLSIIHFELPRNHQFVLSLPDGSMVVGHRVLQVVPKVIAINLLQEYYLLNMLNKPANFSEKYIL